MIIRSFFNLSPIRACVHLKTAIFLIHLCQRNRKTGTYAVTVEAIWIGLIADMCMVGRSWGINNLYIKLYQIKFRNIRLFISSYEKGFG